MKLILLAVAGSVFLIIVATSHVRRLPPIDRGPEISARPDFAPSNLPSCNQVSNFVFSRILGPSREMMKMPLRACGRPGRSWRWRSACSCTCTRGTVLCL